MRLLREVQPGLSMNVQVPSNARSKKHATECILCLKCVEECPKKALKL